MDGQSQDALFASHCEWIQQMRAQYEQLGVAAHAQHDVPSGTLHERFSDALDFDSEPPVYRSLTSDSGSGVTGGLAWQQEELDFDEPVYRSLSGVAGVEAGVEVETAAAPTSHAAWMATMPPLVTRQRAFDRWSP